MKQAKKMMKKNGNRALPILLAIMLALGTLHFAPTVAQAAPPDVPAGGVIDAAGTYDVTPYDGEIHVAVNGVTLTGAGGMGTYVTVDSGVTGLSISGLTLNPSATTEYGLSFASSATLTVVGANSIKAGEGRGINCGGSLTITGASGSSLTATGTLDAYSMSQGIRALGDLTLTGSVAVTANGTADGQPVWASGDMTVSGASLTTTGDMNITVEGDFLLSAGQVNANGSDGVLATGDIEITGGKFIAGTLSLNKAALHSLSGNIRITGGVVKANGDSAGSGGITTSDTASTVTIGGTAVVGTNVFVTQGGPSKLTINTIVGTDKAVVYCTEASDAAKTFSIVQPVTITPVGGGTAQVRFTDATGATNTTQTVFYTGSAIPLTATANSGHRFTGWTLGTSEAIHWLAGSATDETAAFKLIDTGVTITAGFAALVNGSVTPATASFDKLTSDTNYIDVATTLTLGDYTLDAIKLGTETLTENTEYTKSGNTYTFKKEWLAMLPTGANTITFDMDGGTDPELAITVTDSRPVLPWNANAPTLNALHEGYVINVAATATGTLTIPAGITNLTVQGSGGPVTVTGAQIYITNTDLVNLTIQNLTMTAADDYACLQKSTGDLNLTLRDVSLTGGSSTVSSAGDAVYVGGSLSVQAAGTVTFKGGDATFATGGGGDGIDAESVTIAGDLTATGGDSQNTNGGYGIIGTLTVQSGSVTAKGGEGGGGLIGGGAGVSAAETGKSVTVNAGARLAATGGNTTVTDMNGGVGILLSNNTLHLMGEVAATGGASADNLRGMAIQVYGTGGVRFEHADAKLTVQNQNIATSFPISHSLGSGRYFYATGGASLVSQTSATSGTTQGVIRLLQLTSFSITPQVAQTATSRAVSLAGSGLPTAANAIVVKAFDAAGNDTVPSAPTTAMTSTDGMTASGSISLPANATDAAVVYTLKLSLDGGTTWADSTQATVTGKQGLLDAIAGIPGDLSVYTLSTYNALISAKSAAETVRDNATATQSQIDTAENNLLSAISDLKKAVTALTISPAVTDLNVGDTRDLTVNPTPADAQLLSITWDSSNPSAVEVDPNGRITAKGAGDATITATMAKQGNDNFPLTASITITVTGAPLKYTVTYHANGATGGSVPTDSVQYLPGEDVTVCGNTGGLTRSGYTFMGWTLSSGGSGTLYEAGDEIEMRDADIHLYAKWQLDSDVTYTVIYHANGATGGSVPTDSGQYLPGEDLTVRGNTGNLTRSGYKFIGWTLSSNGSGTLYKAGDKIEVDDADIHLYAKWQLDGSDIPQTGDNSNIMLWTLLGLTSILGGLCLLVYRKWRGLKATR